MLPVSLTDRLDEMVREIEAAVTIGLDLGFLQTSGGRAADAYYDCRR